MIKFNHYSMIRTIMAKINILLILISTLRNSCLKFSKVNYVLGKLSQHLRFKYKVKNKNKNMKNKNKNMKNKMINKVRESKKNRKKTLIIQKKRTNNSL